MAYLIKEMEIVDVNGYNYFIAEFVNNPDVFRVICEEDEFRAFMESYYSSELEDYKFEDDVDFGEGEYGTARFVDWANAKHEFYEIEYLTHYLMKNQFKVDYLPFFSHEKGEIL
jgi:hypothetical protein